MVKKLLELGEFTFETHFKLGPSTYWVRVLNGLNGQFDQHLRFLHIYCKM